MASPFLVDPLSLPPAGGEAPAARSSLLAERRRGEESPLRYLIEKKSAHVTLLGENEERWAQEAREALLTQNPWLASFTITDHTSASSPDGYAVGFFRVTPRHVPIANASQETVSVVTIPFIVKDFNLLPLDLFSHGGKTYPLTESRVSPLLRLRDAFTEADREEVRDSFHREMSPFIAGPARTGGYKLSSGNPLQWAAEQVRPVLEGAASQLDAPPSIDEDEGIDALVLSRMRKASAAAAVDVRVDATGAGYRIAWASDPETGSPSVSPFYTVSLAKLSEVVGEDAAVRATSEGRVILNQNPDDAAAMARYAAEMFPEKQEVLKASSGLQHGPARPATPHRLLLRDTVVDAIPVNEFFVLGTASERSAGLTAAMLLDGRVLTCMHDVVSIGECADAPATITPRSATSRMAVWEEDGALWGLGVNPDTINIDGVVFHRATATGACVQLLVGKHPEFRRTVVEREGEVTIVYLPAHAWILDDVGVLSEGAEIVVSAAADGMPAGLPDLSGDVDLPEKLILSQQGGRWALSGARASTGPLRTEQDVQWALAAAGVPCALASAAIKASSSSGLPVPLAYRSPLFGRGADTVGRAASEVKRRLKASEAEMARAVEGVSALVPRLSERVAILKESSLPGSGLAVDTVLSLRFLTRDNLLRFVAMAPTFEKTLCYLCALLLASRLGLDEVSEEATSAAVRGIDAVLDSLRAVEYALAQR